MCSNTSDPVLIYHDVLDPKLRLIHNPKMQTDRTHQHRERPFPKKSKDLFPRPIDFGRFATFPLKKVFFVNQILSGLGEPPSVLRGGPKRTQEGPKCGTFTFLDLR